MHKPDAAHLQAIIGMEPEKAIAYLEQKGFHISWDWHEISDALHARAFTVAKATSIDILQDLRNGMKGRSLTQYQKDLEPILKEKGWWGKQDVLEGDTGEIKKIQLGSPRRLATIYQTNMQSSYMAARYDDALESIDTHPYGMYIAINDASSRPSHAAMHGRIFRLDDPIWASICPPNGFNCRCRFVTLSEADLKRRGGIVENSAGKIGTTSVVSHVDKDTGDLVYRDITTIKISPRNGQKQSSFRPDPGFDSGPQAGHLMDDHLWRKAQSGLPSRAAYDAVQQALLAPIRMKAWKDWVKKLHQPGEFQSKKTFGIGVMNPKDLAFAKSNGGQPMSGVIFIEDKLLTSVKAIRHQNAGNALTIEEWSELPKNLANPERVLWDKVGKNFLYIMKSTDNRAIKLVLRFNRLQRGGLKIDDAATVFKVPDEQIKGGIKGGEYEIVR